MLNFIGYAIMYLSFLWGLLMIFVPLLLLLMRSFISDEFWYGFMPQDLTNRVDNRMKEIPDQIAGGIFLIIVSFCISLFL